MVHPDPLVLSLLRQRNPAAEIACSYIFLGCSRQRDAITATKSFESEAGNRLGQGKGGLLTPASPFKTPHWSSPFTDSTLTMPDLHLGPSVLDKSGMEQTIHDTGAPLSPFHYQLRKVCHLHEIALRVTGMACAIP